jgi:23S rRNA G2445 N2-methylase RlmL
MRLPAIMDSRPADERATEVEPADGRAGRRRDHAELYLDLAGEPLHKRGYKQALNPAPMRETMASLFLRECGYGGATKSSNGSSHDSGFVANF